MNLVFFGTSGFGLPSLEAMTRYKHRLLSVVTQPDRPSGRDLKPKASDVKQWALAHSVPVIEFAPGKEGDAVSKLKDLSPEFFIVISFGRLLKKDVLSIPKNGSLNVHASLLPRWRGASPMQSALLADDIDTGVSVMRMVEKLDAGDVLLQKKLTMAPDETILTLEPKLAKLGAEALLEALDALEDGRAVWTPQEESKVTHTFKMKKEDGRVKWDDTANSLYKQWRAYLAWPGSYFFHGKTRLVIKKCRLESEGGGEPGRVLEAGAGGVRVSARKGSLVLEELQQEGRKAMGAAEFLRGFPLKPGEVLL